MEKKEKVRRVRSIGEKCKANVEGISFPEFQENKTGTGKEIIGEGGSVI